MARREDIETSLWSDPDFLALSIPARLVYIWSFTNPRCGMAGIYQVPRQAITMETGVHGKVLDQALDQLREARFLFFDGRVMFIRTRVKHLRSAAPTIAKAIAVDLAAVASHEYAGLWWAENGHRSWITEHVVRPLVSTGDPDGLSIGDWDPLVGSQGKGKGKGNGNEVVGGLGGEGPQAELEVFEYWQERCHKPRAKFTDERRQRVRARLREKYTVADIRRGIDGAAMNPPRDRDSGVVYDDLVSVCRNGSQLERYMERASAAATGSVRRETASDWLREINAEAAL